MSAEPDVPIDLVVNADDYGYFPCVSRGIVRAARDGLVSATGLLANAPRLDEQLAWLADCPRLDLGVHLNLTSGRPLSAALRRRLREQDGRFPSKAWLAVAVLTGRIPRAEIAEEWRLQIEACLKRGLRLRFLNSHEHVHMLRPLFRIATDLAGQFGIGHVRFTVGEWPTRLTAASVARNLMLYVLARSNARPGQEGTISCVGASVSGRLDLDYLGRLAPRLRPGGVYELMCHPGYLDRAEVTDRRLLAYHDWEQELALLTSDAAVSLFARHRIRVVSYREIAKGRGAGHRETGDARNA